MVPRSSRPERGDAGKRRTARYSPHCAQAETHLGSPPLRQPTNAHFISPGTLSPRLGGGWCREKGERPTTPHSERERAERAAATRAGGAAFAVSDRRYCWSQRRTPGYRGATSLARAANRAARDLRCRRRPAAHKQVSAQIARTTASDTTASSLPHAENTAASDLWCRCRPAAHKQVSTQIVRSVAVCGLPPTPRARSLWTSAHPSGVSLNRSRETRACHVVTLVMAPAGSESEPACTSAIKPTRAWVVEGLGPNDYGRAVTELSAGRGVVGHRLQRWHPAPAGPPSACNRCTACLAAVRLQRAYMASAARALPPGHVAPKD